MSGIYIPGMEMPKRGHTVTLTILGGGEVCVQYYDCKPHLAVPIVYKAIPVPDHGRLGDLDALEEYLMNDPSCITIFEAIKKLQGMPTIIPASKEVEDNSNQELYHRRPGE